MATMIEFAVVLIVKQSRWSKKKKKSTKKMIKDQAEHTETLLVQTLKHLENGITFMGQDSPRSCVRMIDFIALLSFSVTYFIYNCIYFARLMQTNKT